MWPPACTSSVEQQCGSVRPAVPSALHPTVQIHTWNKQRTCPILYIIYQYMINTDTPLHLHPHTRESAAFHVGVCRSRVSANGTDMRTQQVIDEDDVVLWHKRFPLCPGSGWGLLFALPVIAWRIDSEQCAISQTVIKPYYYSFFTTLIWVLETQWATLKWHCCLVTVWPLPILFSLAQFTAPASPSLSNHPLSSFLFAHSFPQSSMLFSVLLLLTFSFTLLQQTEFLASELSAAASEVLKSQSS